MNYIKLHPNKAAIAIELTVADILGTFPEAYEISAEQYRKEMFGTNFATGILPGGKICTPHAETATHSLAGGDK